MKKLFFLAILVTGIIYYLFSTMVIEAPSQQSYQYNSKAQRDIASAEMKCSQFLNLVRTNRPTSLQQTLEIVKRNHPEFFNNYAVAYDSLSLHESSFENPRAIAFSGDAKTILTFNGDPNQSGYERLEIMCFNDEKKTFEFRDIAFPGEAKDLSELEDIPANLRNEPFVISPVNGHPDRDCRMCHGTPPRPNWDTYNLWPGICSFHFPDSHTNYSETVGKKCDAFYDTHKNKGRYSVLGPKPEFNGPAFILGASLTHLNGQRIVAELERRKNEINPIRYQVAEAMYCSHVIPLDKKRYGLPEYNVDLDTIAPKPFDGRAREMLIENMESHAAKLKRMESIVGKDKIQYPMSIEKRQAIKFLKTYYRIEPKNQEEEFGLYDAARVVQETVALSKLEKLLQPTGIEVEQWSMILHGGYGHEGGTGGIVGRDVMPGIIGEEFAKSFLSSESRLIEIYSQIRSCSNGSQGYTCDQSKHEGLRQEMCNIVKPKAEHERQRGGVIPSGGEDATSGPSSQ